MRYKFYTNGTNTVICKSTFAKKVVAGIAKCNPKDEFSLEYGKELAQARCDHKIAKKRLKYAKEQRYLTSIASAAAHKRYLEMQKYMEIAIKDYNKTRDKIKELLS